MAITLGGLATGLDTNALITELMKAERQPITRLEKDKAYQKSRLAAFSDFETKLKTLLSKFEAVGTVKEFLATKSTLSSPDYLNITTTATAAKGTYAVEVVSLARQEKEVAAGVAEGFTSAGGDLTINGKTVSIAAGSTLGQIRDAINGTADIGLSASIINDGTGSPYRLVFTANEAGANGVDITANTTELAFSSQAGSLAQIKVDGIDIFRTTNTISDAVSGVTFDLLKMNQPGETTNLQIATDQGAVKQKVKDIVTAYNDVINFVKKQATADWRSDSGLQSPKRRIQMLLTTAVGGSGSFQTLSELGLETQKDGTLTIKDSQLDAALKDHLADVTTLLVGETGVEGISAKFTSYLKGVTSSTDGILTARKNSTDASIKRIDSNISRLELRLTQREKVLRAQFDALETLTSTMNSQSAFLTQQINSWNRA